MGRNKKRTKKIVKTVAGFGVALGGANAFNDADVVLAAELSSQNEEGLNNYMETESNTNAVLDSVEVSDSSSAPSSEVGAQSDSSVNEETKESSQSARMDTGSMNTQSVGSELPGGHI